MTSDARELVDLLDQRFTAETTWKTATAGGNPEWYGRLLTDLVLVTGDEAIRYLSVNHVPSSVGPEFTTDIVAFTDEVVVFAEFAGTNDGVVSPFGVTACARKSLSSFSVQSELDAFDETAAADWPGPVTFSVTYPDLSRVLPLAATEWPSRNRETVSLLRCLRQDLVA